MFPLVMYGASFLLISCITGLYGMVPV